MSEMQSHLSDMLENLRKVSPKDRDLSEYLRILELSMSLAQSELEDLNKNCHKNQIKLSVKSALRYLEKRKDFHVEKLLEMR
ncbi:hypothetical protein GOV14_03245 [Candidatus Pacearchaeota archaeon]|nr:hypothetical protein [Candidatus Pacearchaeota archaeon]